MLRHDLCQSDVVNVAVCGACVIAFQEGAPAHRDAAIVAFTLFVGARIINALCS